MIVLDTSALIRFFTNDIPAKANKIKVVLESKKVFIPDVVFPELEYVLLSKTYNSSRKDIIKVFEYLILKKNIKTSKEVKTAFVIYKKHNLDIADCIIIASSKNKELISFDKKMLAISSQY